MFANGDDEERARAREREREIIKDHQERFVYKHNLNFYLN
jgi:hypothetical protein